MKKSIAWILLGGMIPVGVVLRDIARSQIPEIAPIVMGAFYLAFVYLFLTAIQKPKDK